MPALVPGLSVNWTSNGTFSAPNAGPGNLNLMSGYLDDTGTAGDTVITVTGVPYANYDVYAYLGSDANNRSGRTRLFNFVPNDRWLRTNSNPFTSFVEGTATTQPASNMGLANYTHYRSLNTSSFNLSVVRGSNNVGLHGIQIVETNGSVPPNWSTGSAPGSAAAVTSGFNSIGLNFIGGRADTAQPDGIGNDDGIVAASAGVPTVAQSNWNNLAGPTGTAAAGSLINRNGTAVAGTTVTWSSANVWSIATTAPSDADAALMKGYLDTNDTSTTTVSVANIPFHWREYDVYVYLDGDANAGRGGNYSITSLTDGTDRASVIDTTNWNLAMAAGGTFAQANDKADELTTSPGFTAGNYLVFPNRHDLSFTLTAQGNFAGAVPPRAPINAIQLVVRRAVPEPGSLVMLALGALALIPGLRRRAGN